MRAPGKAEDVGPPLARRVKLMRILGPQDREREQYSRFLDTVVVAIVSSDVTLIKGKISAVKIKKIGGRKNYRLFREPLIKYKFLPKCSGATLEKSKVRV